LALDPRSEKRRPAEAGLLVEQWFEILDWASVPE
jgi:hypothetical protein